MEHQRVKGGKTKQERAAALREKKKALGESLKRRKAARVKQAGAPSNERRWWMLTVLVLLLLLVRECQHEEPVAIAPELCVSEPVVLGPAEPVEPPPATPTGWIDSRDRPAYPSTSQPVLPWLSAFRMQVSARSPRLATCFVGAPQPGTIKWTVSVSPTDGRVSEHVLEPTLMGGELNQQQRDCVTEVLSVPTYTLTAGTERATPARIGMVIEF